MKKLAFLLFLAPLVAFANDTSEGIQVASLKVKERLQSIEQINVTAEKPAVAVEPESAKVAALLEEAEQIDNDEHKAQSASH